LITSLPYEIYVLYSEDSIFSFVVYPVFFSYFLWWYNFYFYILRMLILLYLSYSIHLPHSNILLITPAPTVLPPSLMANLKPSSSATGVINDTSKVTLSPGITISTPSGNVTTPVTSVVLK